MRKNISTVVIVGGGTAGWLSAALLAARRPDLSITLVEAPNIPTIGVGEGTWPTMRDTLATIGITESEFLAACDASFKQGSRFDGWVDGTPGDTYLHPFTPPPPGDMRKLLGAWQAGRADQSFSEVMTAQQQICARDLAPRQRTMPDYAGALNYGYHLDAAKFSSLLAWHATKRLGVTHLQDEVVHIAGDADGGIAALNLKSGAVIAGDFFIDCSGMAAILIGGHFQAEWIDRSDVSFNDRALAVQVPIAAESTVASQTIATAHQAGWIWDIALPNRRGIGCVYSARFLSDDAAHKILVGYLREKLPQCDPAELLPRKLSFSTGHRAQFWVRNCLAVGLSAGFIEPLEASAIVLIELSLRALVDNFPTTSATLPIHATRFNDLFRYRWERIVDFLKLHYVLSRRDEPYWVAQRASNSIPERLNQQIALWREQPPSSWDFPQIDEIFASASQQYVLYGMGFPVPCVIDPHPDAVARLADVQSRARALAAALPTNRAYLSATFAPPLGQTTEGTKVRS